MRPTCGNANRTKGIRVYRGNVGWQGTCNVCNNLEGQIIVVDLGGLQFRVCDDHADQLTEQLKKNSDVNRQGK